MIVTTTKRPTKLERCVVHFANAMLKNSGRKSDKATRGGINLNIYAIDGDTILMYTFTTEISILLLIWWTLETLPCSVGRF